MSKGRLLLLFVIAAAIAAFFVFDLKSVLSLDYFKEQQAAIGARFQAHPLQTAAIYFAIYVAVTGLSLPGAALMTLAGGAIFGLLWGTLIVSFASAIGATSPSSPRASCSATRSRPSSATSSRRSTAASRRRVRSTSSRCGSCRRSRSS